MKIRTEKKDDVTDDKGMIRVFVYGTLKLGHGNHRLLEFAHAKFVGYDSITGPYRMYNMGSFPAVIDRIKDPEKPILGEIWAMDPEGLASLDMLEGNPVFYCRRKLWTDKLRKRVWTYFLVSDWKDDIADEDEIDNAIWEPSASEKKFWGLEDASVHGT